MIWLASQYTGGCPVLRAVCEEPALSLSKGRESEMLEQVGRSSCSEISAVQAVWHDRQNSAGSIAAHPFDKLRAGSCTKRKDGAPSVKMVCADIIEDGPPAKREAP